MPLPFPPHLVAAWYERQVEVRFDANQTLHSLEIAAQRIHPEAACQIVNDGNDYICYLVKRDLNAYKHVPLMGTTMSKPLPPRDETIAERFLDLVKEANSQQKPTITKPSDVISVMTITETCISSGVAVGLAWYIHDIAHVALAAAFAILFYLRSDAINESVLRISHKYYN